MFWYYKNILILLVLVLVYKIIVFKFYNFFYNENNLISYIKIKKNIFSYII